MASLAQQCRHQLAEALQGSDEAGGESGASIFCLDPFPLHMCPHFQRCQLLLAYTASKAARQKLPAKGVELSYAPPSLF